MALLKSSHLLFALLLSSLSMCANASKLNELPTYPQEVTTIVSDIKEQTVAVKSFNVDMSGCDAMTKMMRIDKVVMDQGDRYPQKMTFRDMKNIRISMPTNFQDLDNASRSWTDRLFSEGDWVSVQYLMCGSGGFPMMTAITKHSAIFPQAGVRIDTK